MSHGKLTLNLPRSRVWRGRPASWSRLHQGGTSRGPSTADRLFVACLWPALAPPEGCRECPNSPTPPLPCPLPCLFGVAQVRGVSCGRFLVRTPRFRVPRGLGTDPTARVALGAKAVFGPNHASLAAALVRRRLALSRCAASVDVGSGSVAHGSVPRGQRGRTQRRGRLSARGPF